MEYGIVAKPSTSGNPMSSAILERIHQVIGVLVRNCNITQHYVDEYGPWSGILDVAAFVIYSTKRRLRGYSPRQLIFGCDVILPIKHMVDWELIRQKKQAQSNKDNIRKNRNLFDYGCKVGDKVMLHKHTAYKY